MTDPKQISALVEQGLPVVAKAINGMRLPDHADLAALRSAAMLGLHDAAKSFNPAAGYSFASYAQRRIRFRLSDEVRRLCPVTRSGFAAGRKIEAATTELTAELNRQPSDGELAQRLGINIRKLVRWRIASRGESFVSIDSEVYADSSTTFHEVLPELSSALEREDAETVLGYVREAVDMLADERHRTIIAMSFFSGMPLAKIGAHYGLTESRIAQIREEAVVLLRRHFTTVVRKDGQADFALPSVSSRPPRKYEPMSKKTYIVWTEQETAAVAKAFIMHRVASPLDRVESVLDKAQAATLPPDRRRKLLSAVFSSRLSELIAMESKSAAAFFNAPANAQTEHTEPDTATAAAHFEAAVARVSLAQLMQALCRRNDLSFSVGLRANV